MTSTPTPSERLRPELGPIGTIALGLGSIVGTGVFVSIGIGAGIAGPAVLVAIAVGALVALCNGLSSAQLAANHPLSGGTYQYGYEYASPAIGFIAGWMFICAKSATAATAAMGLAGYLLNALDQTASITPVALAAVLVLTLISLLGINRTNKVNIAIVAATLCSLIAFIVAGAPSALCNLHLTPFLGEQGWSALLHASALMFVAYTGYGRIATLGEEVRQPRKTIPRAIVAVLLISMMLYIGVGAVAIAAVGSEAFYAATMEKAAPLKIIARTFDAPGISWLLALGAITAMAGVLLNLILGLSRVLLAMGRRGDMPQALARLNRDQTTPSIAVVVVGLAIAGLVLVGNIKTTWSFSAFTILVYYAITNFCALRLPADQRLYPRWIAIVGLVACLGLAFFVERTIWLSGLGLL
ncbi:MAG: APC family permease, partial [Gemmatimonadota bacterium]|nr:APC family permease [Gemmatimonadota bacterium]